MRNRICLPILLLAIAFAPVRAAESGTGPTFVYVSIGGEKKIAIFKLNPENGTLEPNGTASVNGSPGSLTTDPSNKFLYAAIRSTQSVSSFEINPKNGSLKPRGTVPVVSNPTYITTDSTGKYLLSAYYGAGKASVHPINNGIVQKEPSQVLTTQKNPHSILLSPDNRYGYVPCTGADVILQYRWNANKGQLMPLKTPQVVTKKGAGPRHFRFDPRADRNLVYVVNEKNSSVTVYRHKRETGELKARQRIPTLPDDFNKRNTCADIEVTPNGRFLYASNRGHDSLACYAIDPENGRLTAIGQEPTEKTPREFALDPTGSFAYSAGQGSGRLACYRIDKESGKLRRFKTLEVGKSPSWVMAVQFKKQ